MGKLHGSPKGNPLTYRQLFALAPKRWVRDRDDTGQLSGPLPSGGRRIQWDDGCVSSIAAEKQDSDELSGIWLPNGRTE